MTDLDTIFLALWAAAPMYLAIRRAQRQPRQPMGSLRASGLLAFFLSPALWLGYRGWPAAGLVTAIVALLAVASVLVPLTAIRPRLARYLALLAPTVAAILAVHSGGCHVP